MCELYLDSIEVQYETKIFSCSCTDNILMILIFSRHKYLPKEKLFVLRLHPFFCSGVQDIIFSSSMFFRKNNLCDRLG